MAEPAFLFQLFLYLAVTLASAYLVWQDAKRLKRAGRPGLQPLFWAAMVCLSLPIGLAVYVFATQAFWTQRAPRAPSSSVETTPTTIGRFTSGEIRVLYWIFSSVVAVPAAMFSTWLAIYRFPVPDNPMAELGVFVFLLVVFLDVLFVIDAVVARRIERKPIQLGRTAGIFLGGLLGAVAMGFAPLLAAAMARDRALLQRIESFGLVSISLLVLGQRKSRPDHLPPAEI